MSAKEYFELHGISSPSIQKFGLSFDEEKITIPIKDKEGKFKYNKYRWLSEETSVKYSFDPGQHPTLFNIDSIKNSKYAVITEGEMDAIRLDQEGIVAISSTGGAKSFKSEWTGEFKDKSIFICFDSDAPGVSACIKTVKMFDSIKVIELPQETKDICEYLKIHPVLEFKELVKKAKSKEEYLKEHQPEEYSTLTLEEAFLMEFPEEDWIVDKIVPATGMVMMVGESGSGKSFIAADLVRAVITQTLFLDHFQVKQTVPILIIDKENGLKRIRYRMLNLRVPSSNQVHLLFHSENFNLEDEDFLQSISDFISSRQIKLVILDSFIDIMVGNENSSVDTNQVFNSLRSIAPDVCWFILHHDSKPIPRFERSASQKTRGSSNILAQVDLQFYIEKTLKPKIINIEQGKSRDNEPVNKFSIEFQSDETGNMVGFKYVGEVKSEISKLQEAEEFIENFLINYPNRSRQDIIDSGMAKGITEASVKRAIKEMKNREIIDSIKDPNNGKKQLFFISNYVSSISDET